MNLLAFIVFIIVQILFIPFAIVALILVTYKQIIVSRKLDVSQTAVEVLNNRWIMHIFDLRKDTATAKLIQVLPNTSAVGLWLFLFPLYLRYKISSKHAIFPTLAKPREEGIAQIVFNRTIYFDNIIKQAKDEVEQFVVMGAGFDTRCYGDLKHRALHFFELDQAKTQQFKRKLLEKAAIDASHVRFVEVDFSTEHWYKKLEESGYDPTKKSLFLWEGVTLYLSESDARNTLREMKAHSASGSILAADFYALRFVTGEMYPGMKSSLKLLKLTDEEFGFGLDFSTNHESSLQSFIESENATVGATHFMGSKTKKGTYTVVAEIKL